MFVGMIHNRKTRVELHYDTEEIQLIDEMAKAEDRSRKNYCEWAALKWAQLQKSKKKQ